MQQEQKPKWNELPESALDMTLPATIADARYVQRQDMSAITLSLQYCGKPYRVRKNLWAGRGNAIKPSDRCLVAMCSADGLDYDTFARSAPERLDLAHRSYSLTVSVHRTDSGKIWPEILSFTVSEAGKERSKEQILEDATFRLNQQIADLELSLCRLADTQQKADSECRRLRGAYEELAAEYRSVVFERDDLRRRLGMEPGKSILPDNLVDISTGTRTTQPRARPMKEEDLVQNDEILQAFLSGQI